MAKTQAVATQTNSAIVSTEMPDFLKDIKSSRGVENVTADDLVVPRLEVVQALSPCRKKTDPAYIEGAEEGMLFNNVTRELYGEEVTVIPVYFKKEYLVWKDRKKGGGFRGAFPTEAAAEEAIRGQEDAEDLVATDTNQQFCLLIGKDGKPQEVVLSMSKSKAKVSRRWNSLIRMNGGDSFSRVYKISVVSEKNKNNEDYYNIAVAPMGFPTKDLYLTAEDMYNAIKAGAKKADHSVDDDRSDPESEGHGGEY